MMSKAVRFLKEVGIELGKVTWPRRDELVGATIVVFILIAFFSVVLGAMDASFSLLVRKLLGFRGF